MTRPVKPVLAVHYWPTNGHLIEDIAKLGYLRKDVPLLDPTYGKGTFWKRWRPDTLIAHDLKLDGVDFTQLPHDDEEFEQIVFDPPYVAKGGRKTSGIQTMDAAYGQDDCPPTPSSLQMLINSGMREMERVLCSDGILLVKCMPYISSGHYWPGDFYTFEAALDNGLELVDKFIHARKSAGPQPKGRRQLHARNNASTMFVFRKP